MHASDKAGQGQSPTRRFDDAALLRINALLPGWLNEPMRIVTALGYYWVVLPLLAVATYAFYRAWEKGALPPSSSSRLSGASC